MGYIFNIKSMKETSPEAMASQRKKAATDAAYKAHQESSLPPKVVEAIQAAAKKGAPKKETGKVVLRDETGAPVEVLPNTDPNIFEHKRFDPRKLKN